MDKSLPIDEKRFFRLLLSLAGSAAGGGNKPEITEKEITEELFWLIREHFSGDAVVNGGDIVLTFADGEIFDLSVRRKK